MLHYAKNWRMFLDQTPLTFKTRKIVDGISSLRKGYYKTFVIPKARAKLSSMCKHRFLPPLANVKRL